MIASTIPVTRRATPKMMSPILGWNTVQLMATHNKNKGIHTIRAAKNIAKPIAPERKPPRKGT